MVLSTFKFALSFETALSSGLCSCATGETFNMLLALLFLIGWGITTAILTFRADSPLAIIVRTTLLFFFDEALRQLIVLRREAATSLHGRVHSCLLLCSLST